MRTDDPDVRRRGQAMVLVLVVYAAMIGTLGWPLVWLLPSPFPGALPGALVATFATYALGVLTARAGFVDLTALVSSIFVCGLAGILMVAAGDADPLGWLIGIAVFLAAYGVRPSLLVVVYGVAQLTLVVTYWLNASRSFAFLTTDVDFALMSFLLVVTWATSTMSSTWSQRVFARQLEAQAAAEKARQQAEHDSQVKTNFLATMSHELRTPLNAVVGYSELLLESADDSEPLERIRGAGLHLLAIVNDVLDLSRIQGGQVAVHVTTFDVAGLVRSTIEETASSARRAGNTVELDVGERVGKVQTDELLLGQIVLNLLSNALKFTRDGRVEIRISVDDAKLVLSVVDTGIGIAEDQLEQIFEAFEQADASTTRRFGGTGLGLPVSAGLCRLLEGDLSVVSALGEGSTFTARVATVHSAATEAR